MKKIAVILSLGLSLLFTTIHAQNIKRGWIPLTNGKDFEGWHVYGKPEITNAWSIEDGAFHLAGATAENKDSRMGGDLVSDQAYENFELSVEWKISKGGNSGIIFLVQNDPQKYNATYLTGPEMQVLDNVDAPDNKKENHLAGSLYDLIGSTAVSHPKPVGEWNKAIIRLDKGHLQLFLNGRKTADTQMWTDAWKQLVAGSKFVQMPDFAAFKKGHIALQDHGNEVSFRNIKIRQL